MNIAEKLNAIAENQQRVYDAGYAAGAATGGGDQAIAAFWDAFQANGNRTKYDNAFYGSSTSVYDRGWHDSNFSPRHDFFVTSANNMFYRTQITDLKGILERNGVQLDFSKCTTANNLFFQSSITNIGILDFSNLSKLDMTFYYAQLLKNIDKLIVSENCPFYSAFTGADALETVTVEGCIGKNGFNVSSSNLLTVDSLLSILNCLKDYSEDTSGTSWVLTIGSTNKAKLIEEQIAIAEAKGWSVV